MSVKDERRAALRAEALPLRVVSGTTLAALTLTAVWRGGALYAGILFLTLLAGVIEFLLMARRAGHAVLLWPTIVLSAAMLIHAFLPVIPGASIVFPLLGAWFLLDLLWHPDPGRTVGLALSLLAVAYVIGLGIHLEWLRDEEHGGARVFAILLGTWAADTAAFFVGLGWGRHRLAPTISPAKSIEGAVAGWSAAILVTASCWMIWVREGGWLAGVLVGAAVGLAALLGDLLESMFKRNFQVKDTSHLIPGHGGVLDRVDSVLLAATAAYYVSRVFIP